jgi:hypothetical protein
MDAWTAESASADPDIAITWLPSRGDSAGQQQPKYLEKKLFLTA